MSLKKTNKPSLNLRGRIESVALDGGDIEKTFPSGNKVRFKLIEIKSANLLSSPKQSKYNPRRYESLTIPSVADILPSIQESKRNTNPIYLIGTENDYTIAVGLRRYFSVSMTPGATLSALIVEHLESEDEKVLTKVSDMYQKPSFVDLAITVKNELEFARMNSRELGELFGVSKDTSNLAQRLAKLPTSLWSLFPSLNYVTARFARKLTSESVELPAINSAVDAIKRQFADEIQAYKDIQGSSTHYKNLSKQIENAILSQLFPPPKKQENKNLALFDFEGLKAKTDSKGRLMLTFEQHFDEAILMKLANVIAGEQKSKQE